MKRIDRLFKNNSSKRIMNAIFFGIGGAVISKGMLMLFNMIIARMLNEKLYGIYSIINNTVQTFIVFAGAGIGVTLTREVALYKDKNKDLTGIIIKTLLIFNIILSLVVSLIMFVFSNDLSTILDSSNDISLYLKITSFTIFFTSLTLILQSILQGFEKFKSIALGQTISNVIMLLIGVILTSYYSVKGTIISLLILQVLMCTCFVSNIKKALKEKKIHLKFEINKEVKYAIKNIAIPAFLSSIFVMLVVWLTNFEFTKTNGYEEFAAFSVCLQWFNILNYIPQQLGQVKPIYTQLYDEKKYDEFKKIVIKMMKTSICFTTCIAIILGIGNKLVLVLYGSFYNNYSLSFIIMLVGTIFFAIQSQFGSVFQAIGKIWLCLILNIVWAVVFIISFYILNSKGVIGYCITYLLSYAIYSITSLICFKKVLKKF